MVIEFPADDGTRLAGTLTLPSAPGLVAGALLLSGSGPLDRDSNMPQQRLDVAAALAAALAAHGVASLRFDKRGVGASGGEYLSAGFQRETADAGAALAALRGSPSIDPERVAIAGHSVGATIAIRLAAAAAHPRTRHGGGRRAESASRRCPAHRRRRPARRGGPPRRRGDGVAVRPHRRDAPASAAPARAAVRADAGARAAPAARVDRGRHQGQLEPQPGALDARVHGLRPGARPGRDPLPRARGHGRQGRPGRRRRRGPHARAGHRAVHRPHARRPDARAAHHLRPTRPRRLPHAAPAAAGSRADGAGRRVDPRPDPS